MTRVFRRASVTTVGVLALVVVASGCSGPAPRAEDTVGTSGRNDSSFMAIDVTPALAITIVSQASDPLFNVNVAIMPADGTNVFTTTLPRLEPRETRKLMFGEFRAANGTPLTTVLGFVRPKEITVTAVDPGGQERRMTVPWKM